MCPGHLACAAAAIIWLLRFGATDSATFGAVAALLVTEPSAHAVFEIEYHFVRRDSTWKPELAPGPVPAFLRSPVGGWIGEELTLPAQGTNRFFMDFDAHEGPIGTSM